MVPGQWGNGEGCVSDEGERSRRFIRKDEIEVRSVSSA